MWATVRVGYPGVGVHEDILYHTVCVYMSLSGQTGQKDVVCGDDTGTQHSTDLYIEL